MKVFRILFLLLLITLFISCENPFGTDDDVRMTPLPEKKIIYVVDNSMVRLSVGEYYINKNDEVNYTDWQDYVVTEFIRMVIDSSASPNQLSMYARISNELPSFYFNGREYEIEKIILDLKDIPIIKSSKMNALQFPNAMASVTVRDIATDHRVYYSSRAKDVEFVFPMLDPYTIFSVYIDIPQNVNEEVQRLQLMFSYEI